MLQKNSNFFVNLQGTSTRGGALCNIFLVEKPSSAFKYDNANNIVVVDAYQSGDNSFTFELLPINVFSVCFVNDHK